MLLVVDTKRCQLHAQLILETLSNPDDYMEHLKAKIFTTNSTKQAISPKKKQSNKKRFVWVYLLFFI